MADHNHTVTYNEPPSEQSSFLDSDCNAKLKHLNSRHLPGIAYKRWLVFALLLLTILVIYVSRAFISNNLLRGDTSFRGIQTVSVCEKPPVRREWRSLSQVEKSDYIMAVQCLRTIPSKLNSGNMLYDDFPRVHSQNPYHDTAAFLVWHRYFIHVYEVALKEQCGYTGVLTYWNWVLDWKNITRSPVWDSETGFGGNGNVTGEVTVGHGRCVIDGPFAHLTTLFFSNTDGESHCLSRGFLSGEALDSKCASRIAPEAVKKVLNASTYESFNRELESGPHLAIPYGVRGHFLRFSAPYGMYSMNCSCRSLAISPHFRGS